MRYEREKFAKRDALVIGWRLAGDTGKEISERCITIAADYESKGDRVNAQLWTLNPSAIYAIIDRQIARNREPRCPSCGQRVRVDTREAIRLTAQDVVPLEVVKTVIGVDNDR